MGAYQEHGPFLASGMAGTLATYTPRERHWHPHYNPDFRGGRSHNHDLAEAASAMLSSKKADAEEMRAWVLKRLAAQKAQGLATGEPRSSIYLPLILSSEIGVAVGAKRHGFDDVLKAQTEALAAYWSFLALCTFPVRTKGRFTVHRPAPWGDYGGTFDGFGAEKWTVMARGQRSFGRDSESGGVPKDGEIIPGCPTFGSVNQAVHRAITGKGPWGFAGDDSPWPHVPDWVAPPAAFGLKRLVEGDADETLLRSTLSRCFPQYDGCTVVRFERGLLCVTHRKTHGATAATYAAVIHQSGETEFVVLDPGNRSDKTGGTASYDRTKRRVTAKGRGQTLTLDLTMPRYGEVLYDVEFPAGRVPILMHPTSTAPPEPPPPPAPPPPEEVDEMTDAEIRAIVNDAVADAVADLPILTEADIRRIVREEVGTAPPPTLPPPQPPPPTIPGGNNQALIALLLGLLLGQGGGGGAGADLLGGLAGKLKE